MVNNDNFLESKNITHTGVRRVVQGSVGSTEGSRLLLDNNTRYIDSHMALLNEPLSGQDVIVKFKFKKKKKLKHYQEINDRKRKKMWKRGDV